MQLKFKRATETKGVFGNKTKYCVDIMLMVDGEERELLDRFQRWNDNLWLISDAPDPDLREQVFPRHLRDLLNGARFSFDDMNHVVAAEELVTGACVRSLASARLLATFDGSERVIEVGSDGAEALVATG